MPAARFTTWDIDTSLLQQLKKNIKSLNSNHIEYGIVNNEKYPAGDPRGRAGRYVADVALSNEMGFEFTGSNGKGQKVVPRPFFKQSIPIGISIINMQANLLFTMLPTASNPEIKLVMLATADQLADSIRYSIDNQNFEPNRPRTLLDKTSTKVLEDTDVMYNSFSGKVVRGTVPAV